MDGPCFIAHYGSKSSKLRAREEPRNLESKRYWRFNAMSAESYDNVFQNTES